MKMRSTASASSALAPSPYTVSVGNATSFPARIKAAARSRSAALELTSEARPKTGEHCSPQSPGHRSLGRRSLNRETWLFQEAPNGGQGLGAGGRGKAALAGGCFEWANAATEIKGFARKFPESRRAAEEALRKRWRSPQVPRVSRRR